MPLQLKSENWSFTSFSASCEECGCSSEPGDVFYSGLASARDDSKNTDDGNEVSRDEGQSGQEEESPEQEEDQGNGASDTPAYKRVDYCSECWQTVNTDLYSYWRTEVPEPEEDDQEPDRSTLAGLFRGLIEQRGDPEDDGEQTEEVEKDREGSTDLLNQGLLYLLSLMLMRKGFLALENKEVQGGQDRLELRVKGTEDEVYVVHEPELDPETRTQVMNKLAELLDIERNGAE